MIIKNRLKANYSAIPNELITDLEVSSGAFRVAVYLFSKPDNWTVKNGDLKKQLNIKDPHTLAKYWTILIESGWVTRSKARNKKGVFTGAFNYKLNHSKNENTEMGVSPNTGKVPIREKSQCGKNPILNNTEFSNNTDTNSNTDNAEFKNSPPYVEIVDYLNSVLNSKFSSRTGLTRKKIKARFKEGFTLEDFKTVIDNKFKTWANDPYWCKYLRPETLFGGKFDGYLNEKAGLQNNNNHATRKTDDWNAAEQLEAIKDGTEELAAKWAARESRYSGEYSG